MKSIQAHYITDDDVHGKLLLQMNLFLLTSNRSSSFIILVKKKKSPKMFNIV